jgi:Tol biopolymer transport system component
VSAPRTVASLPAAKIDPQSCKPASEFAAARQPPSELYGYELIESTVLVDGNFSYDFWLYCDPALKPDDREHFSAITGLGIYASWHYTGPEVNGKNEYYFQFEPDVPLGKTGWEGPLYKASTTGAKLGINLSEATVQAYIQQGTPVHFRTVVDSPLGKKEADLSFKLEPTGQGLKISALQAVAVHLTSAQDRSIAFVSVQAGNSEIYTMHADGTGLINLTNHPALDVNPFWSPDGESIAFESDRKGLTQIFLMYADGSNVIQVTDGEMDHRFENRNPWSPDGTRLIVTEKAPGDDKWSLYAVGVDGQSKRLLTSVPNNYGQPSWSPDGKHVAFAALERQGDRNTARIYIVDANGDHLANATKLVSADEDLMAWDYSWSPDGQSISVVGNRASSEDGNGKFTAYEASLDGETLVAKASASTRLADWWQGTSFIVGSGGGSPFTWLHSDGTSNTLKPFEKCEAGKKDFEYGYMYKRSSNGNLLIAVDCPPSDLWLYWVNPAGTLIRQLLEAPIQAERFDFSNISWSPDDRFVAFNISSSSGLGTDLYILNVESALNDPSLQPLKIKTDAFGVSWQPSP